MPHTSLANFEFGRFKIGESLRNNQLTWKIVLFHVIDGVRAAIRELGMSTSEGE